MQLDKVYFKGATPDSPKLYWPPIMYFNFILKINYNFNYSPVKIFNDVLSTFYLRLYGVEHMVKDHIDSNRGNPLLPPRGLLFARSSKGYFICNIPPPDRIAHTTASVTPVVEHWLE